jgi:hypothetical protein
LVSVCAISGTFFAIRSPSLRTSLRARSPPAGPLRESFLGRGDRGVHFGFAAGGDFGQHFLRGRVDRLEVVLAGNRLAGDEMVDRMG